MDGSPFSDTLSICLVTWCTSIFSGFAIFTVLGETRTNDRICIRVSRLDIKVIWQPKWVSALPTSPKAVSQFDEFVMDVSTDDSGPGLAFVVFPEGLSMMPFAPLWCVLFFLMMCTLGFGSEVS
jgi:SNF family Na+-dependent transporter